MRSVLQVRVPTTAIVSRRLVESGLPVIVIGIDPHKASLTAVAVDGSGKQLADRRFDVNAGTLRQLCKWASRWSQHRFAVEGAKGLGRGIAQQLAATGADVVDVPAALAARARLLSTGGVRKSDTTDAASVARVALQHDRLQPVVAEEQSTILRLLSEHRDDLTHERTRVLNRLHVLLRDLVPGGAEVGLSADKAAAMLRTVRPRTATDACRRDLARQLLAHLRRLDAQIAVNQTEIEHALVASGSTLTDLFGIGPIMAAKILGHVGDVMRFPSADHFASYTGTSPIEASSGSRQRHRLNTGGNRQLNTALHTIALIQAHRPGRGSAYYQRKLGEGKTPAEARRALKRRLANVIYRHLARDHGRHLSAAA